MVCCLQKHGNVVYYYLLVCTFYLPQIVPADFVSDRMQDFSGRIKKLRRVSLSMEDKREKLPGEEQQETAADSMSEEDRVEASIEAAMSRIVSDSAG